MTTREKLYGQPFDLDEFHEMMERHETAQHAGELADSDEARAKASDKRDAEITAALNAYFYASDNESDVRF